MTSTAAAASGRGRAVCARGWQTIARVVGSSARATSAGWQGVARVRAYLMGVAVLSFHTHLYRYLLYNDFMMSCKVTVKVHEFLTLCKCESSHGENQFPNPGIGKNMWQ